MNEVIERLMAGDEQIAVLFNQARAFWAEFFSKHSDEDAADLARSVGMA